MRKMIEIVAMAAMPVLIIASSCTPRHKPVVVPQMPPSPAECMAKTELSHNVFQNECLGLSFESKMPFLFNKKCPADQVLNIAVPKAGYSIQVFAFRNPARQIITPESQSAFMKAAREHIVNRNPGIKITKEEIVFFGKVPAVYIAGINKDRLERRFFFNNRGQWVQLTLIAKDKNFNRDVKPAQDALLNTLKLF